MCLLALSRDTLNNLIFILQIKSTSVPILALSLTLVLPNSLHSPETNSLKSVPEQWKKERTVQGPACRRGCLLDASRVQKDQLRNEPEATLRSLSFILRAPESHCEITWYTQSRYADIHPASYQCDVHPKETRAPFLGINVTHLVSIFQLA